MKKNLYLSLAMMLVTSFCYAQLPTVVSAPIAEANLATANTSLAQQTGIMTAMNTVIGSLEKADRTYKEAMEKSTWLRNLQTASRLVYMIENLLCTSKNLSVRMTGAGGNCLYSYRYDMMIIKVQQSADYLTIILSAGVAMTAAERMKSLDNVITAFEESQEMMVRLNKALDSDVMRLRLAKSSGTTLKNLYAINRGRSRR